MSSEPKMGVFDVLVTSSINSFGTQRRFPVDITIGELKQKLELLTGASMNTMELQLLDDKKELIAKLLNDSFTLSSYTLEGAKEIHVIDSFRQAGEFEDVSKVQKYEMSDEEYNKRRVNIKAFKAKLKIESNGDQKKTEEEKLKEEEELISKISVGNRCEVCIAGKGTRRGTVMYVGKTEFKPGFWVGVKYDEPMGKNDGSVAGKRYFECEPKYGSFLKPQDVTVGNFPEVTFDDEI